MGFDRRGRDVVQWAEHSIPVCGRYRLPLWLYGGESQRQQIAKNHLNYSTETRKSPKAW